MSDRLPGIESSIAEASKMSGLELYNSDGTINYANARRILMSEEFSDFRRDYPQLADDIKKNLQSRQVTEGMEIGNDILKTAFGYSQLNSANKQDTTPPAFPTRRSSLNEIETQMSRARGARNEGLSPTQRAEMESRIDREFQANRRALLQSSGGSSGSVQAGLQRLSQQEFNNQARITNLDEQFRRTNQNRQDKLLGMYSQEIERDNRARQAQFRQRDMPLYNVRNQAVNQLTQSGIRNVFGGMGAITDDLTRIAQVLGPNMPGTIVRSNIDMPEDSSPMDRIFSRSTPMVQLGTGQGLMDFYQNSNIPLNPMLEQSNNQ